MSPVSGILSDKFSPKVPVLIGIAALAVSFWMNSQLSLYTEDNSILWAMYLRGVAYGLIFTPLSAYSMAGMPRELMAQASGLSSVIRQVGGSFGVALFQMMLTQRITHHAAIFGSSVDSSSAQFRELTNSLANFCFGQTGGTVSEAAARAQVIISQHISVQAFVQAVNDDFLMAALISAACIIPVLFLRNPKKEH